MFGRPINLTFKKQGEIYQTLIGGLMSLAIQNFYHRLFWHEFPENN